MKAFLLYPDQDLPPAHEPTAAEQALTQDLELGPLWTAMAAGDDFLAALAQRVMLAGLASPEAITYRQQVLADAVDRPAVIRQLYDLAGAAITGEKKVYFGLMSNSPESQLFRARIPVETHSGTNEFGMIDEARPFEHSGPYFALLKWGSELKQLILYTILANVFLAPWGLASSQQLGSVALAIVSLLAKAVVVGVVVAVIDNSFAKLRLFKITEFVAAAFLLAVLGVFTLYLGGG